ncbi:MAG: carboxy-S-adenosyl-L-methionine synthase CmoA [Spirochaetia bacterium]|nr:carboxy-S-adenosyl-L-methionine synthase CmoA [Spirochaetia bacterium]
MKDEIYKKPLQNQEKFEFSQKVAGVFDDMISRSVPYYEANQIMTSQMTVEFYKENSMIYDLGCSIGTTAHFLNKAFGSSGFSYTGIDNSKPMIEEADKKINEFGKWHNIQFVLGDIENYDYKNTSVVIANYTFQFIPPERRLLLLQNIFSKLCAGGILLLSEKVIEKNQTFSRIFSQLHHNMKKAHGYSDLEIIQKRDALEDVLIPNTTDQNLELLKDAGFQNVAIYHKWYNFASYIALKT